MGEDGLAKKERMGARLPHEEDMYDELAIFYPNRLSSASRAAVYDRMKAMDTKNKPDVGAGYRGLGAVLGEGMKGYVPEDRDMAVPGQRALDPRKPGKMLAPQRDALKEQRAASGRSTVVAPVYVVILDHDDYENARKKGDIAWAKLMKKHPTYFKEADRYKLLFDANGNATGMEINRDYVLPGKAFPPRTEGEPRTFDAPTSTRTIHSMSETSLVRCKSTIRARFARGRRSACASRGSATASSMAVANTMKRNWRSKSMSGIRSTQSSGSPRPNLW